MLFIVTGFIGQVAVYFHRTAQNDKKIERLEDRMDKRFSEMLAMIDKRIGEVNQRLSDMQAEIHEVRSEMSDVHSEMQQLNQNHIEHLNRHHFRGRQTSAAPGKESTGIASEVVDLSRSPKESTGLRFRRPQSVDSIKSSCMANRLR